MINHGFRYFNASDLKQISLDNITQEVLINYDTREVVSLNGFEIDGVIYYKLKDIPNYIGYNVEYVNKNTEAPTFTVEQVKLEDGSYKFTIKDIVYSGNVQGGTVSYKLHSDANWILNGDDLSFTVTNPGLYDIKFTDKAGNSTTVQKWIYVEEGLLLHLDGENNTRTGHNPNSTVWEDLSSNGNDRALINFANNSWTNNSLIFDGIDDYLNDILISNINAITFQIVMKNDITDIYRNIYDKYYAEIPMLWLNPNSKLEFSIYNTLEQDYNNKKIVITNAMTRDISNMYVNTEKVIEDFEHSKEIEGTYQLFNRNTAQTFKGEIYSLRIYTKYLTESEIKANCEIDKYRFNLTE